MVKRLTLLITLFAAALVTSAAAATATTPKCGAVSPALVQRFLGGTPTAPKRQASGSVIICHYTTVDIIYLLNQTKALFEANQKSNHGSPISGLGAAAFSYRTKGSPVISVEVLHGNLAFIVSGSTAGLTKTMELARQIIPRL